jgi:hypothetical protein
MVAYPEEVLRRSRPLGIRVPPSRRWKRAAKGGVGEAVMRMTLQTAGAAINAVVAAQGGQSDRQPKFSTAPQ